MALRNGNLTGSTGFAVVAAANTVNVTSLTVTASSATTFTLVAERVPGSATTCESVLSVSTLYAASLAGGVPLSAAFPTPLQYRPPSGSKVCLMFQAPSVVAVSISGYYGS